MIEGYSPSDSPHREKIEDRYAYLEEEQDFLSALAESRRHQRKHMNHTPIESHGFRGRDDDYRRIWRRERGSIEKNSAGKPTRMKSRYVPREKWTDESVQVEQKKTQSIMDGFLQILRKNDIRVSTSEWLQFIRVIYEKAQINDLKELVENDELLIRFRLYARATLIKNKADEAAFHEAFDEYFELITKIYYRELELIDDKSAIEVNTLRDSGKEPELKEQLGIKDVEENLSDDEGNDGREQVHGGKNDQHNDILKKQDLSKKGGGDKNVKPSGDGDKEQPAGTGKETSGIKTEVQARNHSVIPVASRNSQQETTELGYSVGGGKGKSVFSERKQRDSIYGGEEFDEKAVQERKERIGRVDRRLRYEERPDEASMREVIRSIRRIIQDVSEAKSNVVDLKGTVRNFAQRNFRFDYEREREKQPEIALLIDVGGPVDEWSPLVKELAEAMTKGLTKLEVYLFHNNLYGYVWKPDPDDLLASSYAKPNSLIDIKSIVKRRKKVIIYGDAEMSSSEFQDDGWAPRNNEERVKRFGMDGEKCLSFIKKTSDAAVWISPVFQKEWKSRDSSGTIQAIGEIIPMYDLTVGGMEDAVKKLIKK